MSIVLSSLQTRLGKLEEVVKKLTGASPVESAPPPTTNCGEDGDFDLFGSEDEEVDEQRQKRLPTCAEKKANSESLLSIMMALWTMLCTCNIERQVVAKSSILLDVKPVGELLLIPPLMNFFIIILLWNCSVG